MFVKIYKTIKNAVKVHILRSKPEVTHFNADRNKPKRGFETEQKANNSAKKFTILTGDAYGSYRCPDCGEWHIGKL